MEGSCFRCGTVTRTLVAGLWVCDLCARALAAELGPRRAVFTARAEAVVTASSARLLAVGWALIVLGVAVLAGAWMFAMYALL